MSSKNFKSKILLFGEYTVMKGSKALLFPFEKFSGVLSKNSFEEFQKVQNLIDYFENSPLLKKHIKIDLLKKDANDGLSFLSTIPQGQGLGSSGALTAALLWSYGIDLPQREIYDEGELSFLKDLLALMESFYHGSSSGMDPLVSYVDSPILTYAKNKVRQIEPPSMMKKYDLFLIPTYKERKASTLIFRFLDLCEKNKISKSELNSLIEVTDNSIDYFLSSKEDALFREFYHLSKLQFLLLEEMIPEELHKIWFKSLDHKNFLLKICGAGGGGYFMGMAPKGADLSTLKDTFRDILFLF